MSRNLRRDVSSESDEDGDVFDKSDGQSSDEECEKENIQSKNDTDSQDGRGKNQDEANDDGKRETEILSTWDMMKKDPSFVPRASRYFLHDDRGGDEAEGTEEKEKEQVVPKAMQIRTSKGQKLWRAEHVENEWKHDKFEEIMETGKNGLSKSYHGLQYASHRRGRTISRRGTGGRVRGRGRGRGERGGRPQGRGIGATQTKFTSERRQRQDNAAPESGSREVANSFDNKAGGSYSETMKKKGQDIGSNRAASDFRGKSSGRRFPRRGQSNVHYVVKQIVAT